VTDFPLNDEMYLWAADAKRYLDWLVRELERVVTERDNLLRGGDRGGGIDEGPAFRH